MTESDLRISAMSIGVTCAAILAVVLATVVLLDIPKILGALVNRHR